MNLKIIGNSSSNRTKLVKNVGKAIDDLKLYTEIDILDDCESMKKYHISNTPAFVINDKVISQGKILTEKEIKKYINILA